MEIQVRTDRHTRLGDELASFVGFELLAGLGPCAGRVLSACVHLTTDWSRYDGRPLLRCLLEVRPVDHMPLAVTHLAATHDDAVRAAVGDMRGLLERIFGRIDGLDPRPSPSRGDGPDRRRRTMDIQVRTDYHVDGDQGLIAYVEHEVSAGLDAFSQKITSVQVHLGEESGARKGPHNLRCLIEVRLGGHEPVVVTRHASTKDVVVRSAVTDVRHALERLYGRLDTRHSGAATIRRPAAPRR